MIRSGPEQRRDLHAQRLTCDLTVVGGGLAGVCCAITAARAGVKVTLIQDRPVLGGNSSSEVRLWVLGATSHMGNNNRWAREGGVVDEILVENTFRNPEGNAVIFDTVLLEKVSAEPNITLLLNTAVFEAAKNGDAIESVRAFCSQNSTMYDVRSPLFCDASGDGVLGFMAGAAFRMGAETHDEFGEKFAPTADYGELLGHSIYFYTKDVGRPVSFVAPAYALKDITQIPRWRHFNADDHGCQLWWIEYGGRLDTVHQTEAIKWELWKVVYGVWDHIKNSGRFSEAANLTLEWVGTIPGKRESRRFEGDVMLTQQDVVEQRRHDDDVSFGGWAIDLHPADGVFSEKPGCNQWHTKGVYPIPYRCMYCRNVGNLFLAGRIISVSHVAFASTRVMATCAHGGQAVGMAAAVCRRKGLSPRDLAAPDQIVDLQRALLRAGQYIPHVMLPDDADLAAEAEVSASSEFALAELPAADLAGRGGARLSEARAMLFPVKAGAVPRLTFWAWSDVPTELTIELRASSRLGNYTPDVVLARRAVHVGEAARKPQPVGVGAGSGYHAEHSSLSRPTQGVPQEVTIDFGVAVDAAQYLSLCFLANPEITVATSDVRVTGVLALTHRGHKSVARSAVQTPPEDIGVDAFEFWLPERRPKGQNLAMRFEPPIAAFRAANVRQGPDRPTRQPNAWVAAADDPEPTIELTWSQPQEIALVDLSFDTDLDHPMESVLWGHPERTMPFCVRHYRIFDGRGTLLAEVAANHQTRNSIRFPEPVLTDKLRIELEHPSGTVPAALFRVRCYARADVTGANAGTRPS